MKYCDNTHKHSHINGSNSKGVLKSALAQDYTNGFCKSVVSDMKLFLSCPNVKPEYECFPVLVESDEEQVDDDPYDPETERAPKRILLPVPQPVDEPPQTLSEPLLHHLAPFLPPPAKALYLRKTN